MEAAVEAAVEAANATGIFILDALSPVPEEVLVCVVGASVVWIWVQNARAWLRAKRSERLKRRVRWQEEWQEECDECEQVDEPVEDCDVGSKKTD